MNYRVVSNGLWGSRAVVEAPITGPGLFEQIERATSSYTPNNLTVGEIEQAIDEISSNEREFRIITGSRGRDMFNQSFFTNQLTDAQQLWVDTTAQNTIDLEPPYITSNTPIEERDFMTEQELINYLDTL